MARDRNAWGAFELEQTMCGRQTEIDKALPRLGWLLRGIFLLAVFWLAGFSAFASVTAVRLDGQDDGWNLLAELNDKGNMLERSYIWGVDISGANAGQGEVGAGGVGGLVAVTDSVQGTHFAAMDGQGNVVGLVNAGTGTWSAKYEYDPFGQLLRVTGYAAEANPFRFSTRYTDSETEMVYYGFRYYNPSTGRWLNRDPIGELGGLNLYGFVGNAPTDYFDLLGLYALDEDGFPIEGSYGGWGAYVYDPETKAAHDRVMCDGYKLIKEAIKEMARQAAEEAIMAATLGPVGKLAKYAKLDTLIKKGWNKWGRTGWEKTKEWWFGKRAERVLAPAKRTSGSTVLGHYPDYSNLADSLGHRRFDIPKQAWDRMTDAERWAANKKFLDRTIARGDEIILTTPLDKIRPGSYFSREIGIPLWERLSTEPRWNATCPRRKLTCAQLF